ncbi:3-hydroxyacyl-[acyl-carrier-protein] dehydratase [Ancylobacter aquaticus]|uniref:3-hydroxyacyl-[acyl-carrier-protein] dehydratase FabZ n=1 Tax=Ancylobacter aquaticus TaxID=100 RepID=A0A4R1I4Y0_ANCAQ|nr:3-hydroxyacyl-ACP dehydratase FabZ [Ancylobacter aquaticus]TCK28470.1 3-hydroxyacyl-[acyl-carrier-protein] dehydratase [Ancylobacter aquaticus]
MDVQSQAEVETTALGVADIQRILATLPHRYPFLMVDRIVGIEGDKKAIGIKNVSANEPHFQGHFPDNPVMPGVLILEGMAQTAGTICLLNRPEDGAPSLVYFMTIDKAKFRKPVLPGDVLEYHMTQMSKRRNMWWFRGEAKVGGQIVAEAEVGAMIARGERK